eukprot:TRINITY_DN6343_c0_g2_i2.p1 TRINITY_DN6343_c0_g2~~TRINITY_DN6343_c0_g2_i2.p1  ORF type:complete len:883 (-),score=72.76 TRINITY_DN6343_c0_g2_i2:840-3464(-)
MSESQSATPFGMRSEAYTTFCPTSPIKHEHLSDLRFAPVMDRLDLGHPEFYIEYKQDRFIAEPLKTVDTIRYLRLHVTIDSESILLAIRESVWKNASMISITCLVALKEELCNAISSLIKVNTNLQVLHLHGTNFLPSLAPPSLKRLFYSGNEVEQAFVHAVRSGLAHDALFQYIGRTEFMRRPTSLDSVPNGFVDVLKQFRTTGNMDNSDPFLSSYYDLQLDMHKELLAGVAASINVRPNNFLPSYTLAPGHGNPIDGVLRHQRAYLGVQTFMGEMVHADHYELQRLCRTRAEALEKIKIAVLDSGINTFHPDLRGTIDAGKTFAGGDWRFDWLGHGTHFAGMIAGARGGIAAGARLYVGKVLQDNNTSGRGEYATTNGGGCDLAAAIRWAMDKGVDIITMSVLQDRYDDDVYKAVMDASTRGIIIIATAYKKRNYIPFPASIEGIIHDKLADIRALGNETLSTSNNGHYKYMSGASTSTPFIVGACALLLAYDRALNSHSPKIRNTHIMKHVLLNCKLVDPTAYFKGAQLMNRNQLFLDEVLTNPEHFQQILQPYHVSVHHEQPRGTVSVHFPTPKDVVAPPKRDPVASNRPETLRVFFPNKEEYTTFIPAWVPDEGLPGLCFARDMECLNLDLILDGKNSTNDIAQALNTVAIIRFLRINISFRDNVDILNSIRESVWRNASVISIKCSFLLEDKLCNNISSYINGNVNISVLHLHGPNFLSSLAPPSLKQFIYSGGNVQGASQFFKRSGLEGNAQFQYIHSFDDITQDLSTFGRMVNNDPFLSSIYDLHNDDRVRSNILALPRYKLSNHPVSASRLDAVLDRQRARMSVNAFMESHMDLKVNDRAEALSKIKIAILDSGNLENDFSIHNV